MCENEEERHLWRAEVLTFVRDHIESSATAYAWTPGASRPVRSTYSM
jgi:hypothetical protein